jgi:hypothetical protein
MQEDKRSWGGAGRRIVAATVAGLAVGVLVAIAAAVATAHHAAAAPEVDIRSLIDATHLPPLLTLPDEPIRLRYDITCVAPGPDPEDCRAGGSVFLRAGQSGPFQELPLQLDASAEAGRWYVAVPDGIAGSASGFSYYAVLRNLTTGASMTLPAGGAAAPQRSYPMRSPVTVDLGTHTFDAVRAADARVAAAAWGGGAGEAGLEGGPQESPAGATAFDVDESGVVTVLDEANRRLLRFAEGHAQPEAVSLPIDGTLADMSVAPDGSVYVLESDALTGETPLLRRFDLQGREQAEVPLAERTASAVRIGPAGPVTLQYPAAEWMPAAADLSRAAQEAHARPGRPVPGGDEVVVSRQGNEARIALVGPAGVRRSWRILSSTPIAEIQLAEPLGSSLLAVLRTYTDTDSEFVVLVLDSGGAAEQFSVPAADWAETAPLTRFRLSGNSLYKLGSTLAGMFVDRYDLGVS